MTKKKLKKKTKRKKAKRKPGRPRITFLTQLQLKKMDRMAMDQCKHRTIAEVLGVGREPLRLNYLPRLHKKSAEGRVALRASQRRMSNKQPVMAIFLGKQYLEQSDKQEAKVEVNAKLITFMEMIRGTTKGKLPDSNEKRRARK